MRYAIVAGAWMMAWGALAPQDAGAGFVLCVGEGMSSSAATANHDWSADSSTNRPVAPEVHSPFDNLLGVIEVPGGARAPSNSQHSQSSAQACLHFGAIPDPMHQPSISSRLSLAQMFSLRTMYKSAVFRPPRV